MDAIDDIKTLMRDGRWRDAQVACEEFLSIRPTATHVHAFEGLCFYKVNDFACAAQCFRRAAALDPTFVDAAVKLTQCLERIHEYDEAVYVAREWIDKRPSDPTLNAMIKCYGDRPNPLHMKAWNAYRQNRGTRSVWQA